MNNVINCLLHAASCGSVLMDKEWGGEHGGGRWGEGGGGMEGAGAGGRGGGERGARRGSGGSTEGADHGEETPQSLYIKSTARCERA